MYTWILGIKDNTFCIIVHYIKSSMI